MRDHQHVPLAGVGHRRGHLVAAREDETVASRDGDGDHRRAAVLDEDGHPRHERGATSVPGFHFLGLPWLHTWGSGRFHAIARDAEHVASLVAEGAAARAA